MRGKFDERIGRKQLRRLQQLTYGGPFCVEAQVGAEDECAQVQRRVIGRIEIRRAVVQLEPGRRDRDDDFLAVELRADRGQILEYHQTGRRASADRKNREAGWVVLEQVARVIA